MKNVDYEPEKDHLQPSIEAITQSLNHRADTLAPEILKQLQRIRTKALSKHRIKDE